MEDLEVACPVNNPMGEKAYILPSRSGDAFDEAEEVKDDASLSLKFEGDTVTGKFDHDMGMRTEMLPDKTVDQVFQIGFGERIKSFRTLLKRPQTLFYLNGDNSTGENYFYFNAIPRNYRYYPVSSVPFWMTATPSSYPNLFDYLRGAFIGMRGGFRYSIIPYNNTDSIRSMSANRFQGPDSDPSTYAPTSFGSCPINYAGAHFALMSSNPALSFESPYYDTSRFLSAQGSNLKGEALFPHPEIVERVRLGVYSIGTDAWKLNVTAVPADDFTFIGRVGAPPVIHMWDT
jgi:hypothetical protein